MNAVVSFFSRTGVFIALVMGCLTQPASAAITVDASSQQIAATGTTSFGFNHTLGTGSNRLVVCSVQIANPTTAVTNVTPVVTFGGFTMTAIAASQAPGTGQNTSKIESEMFYLNDVTLGSTSGVVAVNVTLPSAPTGGVSAGCTSFFGMAQAGPEAEGVAYNGSGTAQTISLTTATAGDLVVDSFAGGFTASSNPTKTALPNAGQTALYNSQLSTAGILGGSSYEIAAAAGSVSVGWADTVSRLAYSAVAFAPTAAVNYTVTTAANPVGTGTVTLSPNQLSYATGSSITVTATPAQYYVFTGFSGDVTGTTNPATLLVDANKSVTANFTQAMCNLTVTYTGQGSVSPVSGSYACGSTINLSATPNSGYSFGQWSGGGYTGTNSAGSFTLTADTTETASFIVGTVCTLATSVTGSGSVTLSPAGGSYSCGSSVQVTAVPYSGDWSFTGFSGAITGATNPQTLVLNTNSSVNAAFTQINFPVNVTVVGPGTVSASPSASSYAQGTSVQLTATPNAGAYFVGFTGDLTSTSNPASVIVNATRNITATFAVPVITQDAVSHAATTATATSLTWTHTLGSGTARAVVIAVGSSDSAIASPDAAAVVTGVYFNGVYATPIPGSLYYGGTTGMSQTQLFYLTDAELPPAGTYTVQVNLAGSVTGIQAGAISLFGVYQGPPEAVAINRITSGTTTSLSTPITTLTNNAWVIDVIEDTTASTLAQGSGQTLAWTAASAIAGTGGNSTEAVPTAGTVSMSWTSAKAQRMVQSVAAFPPAGLSAPVTYTLSGGGSGGTITTNPGLSNYPAQTAVQLTATPALGYSFSSWSIDAGASTSTANPYSQVMDANHSVTAIFTSAPTCALTFNIVGTGTVSTASGSYNCGTVFHLLATPGSGYTFTSWSGDFASTDNPAYFTLNADSNITVEFDPIAQCTLTVSTVGTGSITPGSGSYACGTTVSLQATVTDSSYAFAGFSGDYSGTANPASITLNNNMAVTGTFVQGSACTFTSTVVGSGTVTPSSASYLCGTTISVSALPVAHYLFNGWSGGLTGSATPISVTLNSNISATATFVYNTTGITGDPRTVVEPVYPPVCSVLSALQTVSSPVESSPDTARVQAALNACPAGQAVEFSASGSYNGFIIAPITLPAGVTMLVDPEVTIMASINSADYSCVSSLSWCTPVIDVAANTYPNPGSAIMGLGVIDGRGGTTLTDLHKSWWATGSNARPRLIFLSSHTNTIPADNFTMYKITLKNSPKFHFSGIGNDLTVWGVKVIAPPDSPNTDGIDPSSSENITITNSYISDGDDMIAMKAGNGHIDNVTISNNHMYSGHGITIGSETNAGLNNMYVHDDAIDNGFGGSSVDTLRIKSDTSRGGEVYDVLYKNICINHGGDTIVIDPYYSSETGTLIPNFHDITFSNVHMLIRDSSHKSTMTGYNTGGIVNPLTVTLDSVYFDGATSNDFKAPDNFNNVQFTLGAGPVSFASFLTADAAIPANLITVTNNVSNSNAALDCSAAFVYLAGDLTAPTNTATAGAPFTVTAVLQNLVSPMMAGTIGYPQQNMPTGTINLLEGSNIVGTGSITSGNRLTYITIPSVTTGTHTYTAQFLGNTNYSALNFGSLTITATGSAPVAAGQSINVAYNTATAVTLSATGNGTLTYSVVASPAHGTLSGTAPNLTYTPTSGYYGADSFTFKANNGADSNVATISITVLPPAPPVAAGQSITVPFNTSMPITLTATGVGTITYSVLTNPTHGILGGTLPNLTYTPATGYFGTDSFTFNANNGSNGNTATISITVLPAAPGASAQSVTAAFNAATAVTLSATGNGTLTYSVVASPAHGALSGTAPNLTYTPTSGYYGADSFTFKANNGTDSNVATVSITVLPAAPVASAQSVTVTFNAATAVTLSATGNGTLTYSVVASPAHGTLSGTAPNLTYTPTSGYYGADSFTFKVNNGTDSNVATVSITVNGDLVWTVATGGSLTATVTSGHSATYALQVAGWTGDSNAVTFTCAGAPTFASCTVTPTSSAMTGVTPVPVTVTVSTQTLHGVMAPPTTASTHGKTLPIAFAAGLVGFLGLCRKYRGKRLGVLLSVLLVVLVAGSMVGCGGGGNPPSDTVPGTYTLTVTATSGSIAKNVSLTLIVQ
ncbi:MAG: glycosyl hydrolase family 28 protein [Acidobacteriaceae bacterium]|nr:glycosyl hydrolase family 28 protein [Acidobacteriaceae bacterium]